MNHILNRCFSTGALALILSLSLACGDDAPVDALPDGAVVPDMSRGVRPDGGPPDTTPMDGGATETDGGTTPPDRPELDPAASAFVEAARQKVCAYAVRCEPPFDPTTHHRFCHPAYEYDHGLPGLFDTDMLPFMAFDDDAAEACLERLDDAAESCVLRTADDPCYRVFAGTGAVGDACHDVGHCGPGLHCAGESEELSCTGTCQPDVALGADCSDGPCAAGLRCAEGVCVARADVGGACSSRLGCLPHLDCNAAGRCFDPVDAVGQPCERRRFDTCPPPTRCGDDGVCEPHTLSILKAPGEACISDDWCAGRVLCIDEVCVPQPVLGEACTGELECMVGTCLSGVCGTRMERAPCERDDQCDSGRCEDDRCVRTDVGEVGDPCTTRYGCPDGVACRDGVCTEAAACD